MNTLSLRLPIISQLSAGLKTRVILKVIFGLIVASIVPLLAVYIFQVGDLINLSFSIKGRLAEVEEISESKLALDVESTELLSLAAIEEKIQESEFVKVTEIKYLPIPSHYLVASENK